jgi:hypothetical protein
MPRRLPSSTVKKSSVSTAKSANCPTAMRPFWPSLRENQLDASVHIRSTVSRSSRFAGGYSFSPPTVRPVTNHERLTHGL